MHSAKAASRTPVRGTSHQPSSWVSGSFPRFGRRATLQDRKLCPNSRSNAFCGWPIFDTATFPPAAPSAGSALVADLLCTQRQFVEGGRVQTSGFAVFPQDLTVNLEPRREPPPDARR